MVLTSGAALTPIEDVAPTVFNTGSETDASLSGIPLSFGTIVKEFDQHTQVTLL